MSLSLAVICGMLKEKMCSPVNKLLSLRFTKDLVETLNDDFISLLQKSPLMGIMEKIALFKVESDDEQRGKEYFHFDGKASNLLYFIFFKIKSQGIRRHRKLFPYALLGVHLRMVPLVPYRPRKFQAFRLQNHLRKTGVPESQISSDLLLRFPRS